MKYFLIFSMLLCGISLGEVLTIDINTGTAIQLPTPLTIQQTGHPAINIAAASYSTNPFSPDAAPYYDIRVGLWDRYRHNGWELELLHDKLYLDNPPPDVQVFRITHGFNMLFVNRAWNLDPMIPYTIFRIGLGPVITHPINTVNGETYSGGEYSFSGLAYQLGLQIKLPLDEHFHINIETKWTGASAVVPIANGEAVVPNNGLHILGGLGIDF
jgi:hypothetical protein